MPNRNDPELSAFGQMPRYYFDERDNDKFVVDDEGIDLASFEQVKVEASRAMADFAKDVLPGSIVRLLAIEVRQPGARSQSQASL